MLGLDLYGFIKMLGCFWLTFDQSRGGLLIENKFRQLYKDVYGLVEEKGFV